MYQRSCKPGQSIFLSYTTKPKYENKTFISIPLRHDFESDEWRNTASIFIPGLFLCQEG